MGSYMTYILDIEHLTQVTQHTQKLLDGLPKFYCPNQTCSAHLEAPNVAYSVQNWCPACNTSICVLCRGLWHEGFTCEQNRVSEFIVHRDAGVSTQRLDATSYRRIL